MKILSTVLDLNVFDEEVDRILGGIQALKVATIVSKHEMIVIIFMKYFYEIHNKIIREYFK